MKKAISKIVVSLAVIAGILVWLLLPEKKINSAEILSTVVAAVIIIFGLYMAIRNIRSVRQNLPAEDERSKKIMKSAGATAYYISLYLWLALMFFEEDINLEKHSLIGLGILGMALVFALSWIYHNFLSTRND